jgi:hypothetical protein
MVKLSFIDRILLFRYKILEIGHVSEYLSVLHTSSKDVPILVKFSRGATILYYKITPEEADGLIEELNKVRIRMWFNSK